MKNNGALLINEKCIVKTYPKKWWELYFQHEKVTDLRRKTGWSKYKISDYLNVSEERVKHWIYDGTEPMPVKVIRSLKSKGLLPFSEENRHFQLIMDCFSFVYGDGTLTENRVMFSGRVEDLEEIKRRLSEVGFCGKIRTIKTENYIILGGRILNGTTNDLIINSAPLAKLLACMGAPVGDKTIKPIHIPPWLKKSDLTIKKRFLGVLYGCEGKTPKFAKGGMILGIKFSKNIEYKREHEKFMKDIKSMFSEFGIRTSNLVWDKKVNNRKDGVKTQACHFTIGDFLSILKFLNGIEILCCRSRTTKTNDFAILFSEKFNEFNERHEKYEQSIGLSKNLNTRQISRRLGISYKTVEYWIKGGKPVLYDKRKEINKEIAELRSKFPAA
jgi:intein/homing endonuclease